MKPYKVNEIWIDLDHIVSIEPYKLYFCEYRIKEKSYYYSIFSECSIVFMFVNNYTKILIGSDNEYVRHIDEDTKEELDTLWKQRYNKLVEAWKYKDNKI
jgi:hypothetical protein